MNRAPLNICLCTLAVIIMENKLNIKQMAPLAGLWERILTFGRMVKFSHTVFALPFAISGAALAAARSDVTWRQVLWILLAMVAARNSAMGFNRLVDQEVDARNERTANRELPRGRVSRPAVWTFTLLLAALFVFVI